MSTLKSRDKAILEKAFEMGSGYVLDFSDRTMEAFFAEEFEIEIYDEKYDYNFPSKSKANRMRGIWQYEDDEVVSQIIIALIDYAETVRLTKGHELSSQDKTLFQKAKEIANNLYSGYREESEWQDEVREYVAQEELQAIAPEIKDLLYELRDYHQAFIDLLEIFCENTKKPQSKHNEAYVKLADRIPKLIEQLEMKHNKVEFYRPFKGDLYSAELEWNGDGFMPVIGPELSWDALRPKLHKVHSEIIKLINIAEQESEMTDDEKELESITALVADHRAKKASAKKVKDKVQKVHVTYKQENNKSTDGFYIEKKGDDFYYKGDYLPLSKTSDYYKVFCALFAKLPEGGTIKYKDLFDEVRSRIKKVKAKSDTDLKTFILNKLTNTQNGFLRQAKIPATQDNGKPLIAVERGHGIVFNNKMG